MFEIYNIFLHVLLQRIPKSFINEFGMKLSSRLLIRCEMFVWKCKCDVDREIIYGMRRFIKCYDIKVYNVIQFDYYGDNVFVVKIFRNTTIECNDSIMEPAKFLENEKHFKINKDLNIIDGLSLQYQKAYALWFFNACQNFDEYFEIKILNVHINGADHILVSVFDLYMRFTDDTGYELIVHLCSKLQTLSEDMVNLYKH